MNALKSPCFQHWYSSFMSYQPPHAIGNAATASAKKAQFSKIVLLRSLVLRDGDTVAQNLDGAFKVHAA